MPISVLGLGLNMVNVKFGSIICAAATVSAAEAVPFQDGEPQFEEWGPGWFNGPVRRYLLSCAVGGYAAGLRAEFLCVMALKRLGAPEAVDGLSVMLPHVGGGALFRAQPLCNPRSPLPVLSREGAPTLLAGLCDILSLKAEVSQYLLPWETFRGRVEALLAAVISLGNLLPTVHTNPSHG